MIFRIPGIGIDVASGFEYSLIELVCGRSKVVIDGVLTKVRTPTLIVKGVLRYDTLKLCGHHIEQFQTQIRRRNNRTKGLDSLSMTRITSNVNPSTLPSSPTTNRC